MFPVPPKMPILNDGAFRSKLCKGFNEFFQIFVLHCRAHLMRINLNNTESAFDFTCLKNVRAFLLAVVKGFEPEL
jgi:hypothetical protein